MYKRGISSRMEAILKNQLRQVSFADIGTISGVKLFGRCTTWPLKKLILHYNIFIPKNFIKIKMIKFN